MNEARVKLITMKYSQLYDAVLANKTDRVTRLLKTLDVSEINFRSSNGKSLLHIAVENGVKLDIFRTLLTYIDITKRDENCETVLDIAHNFSLKLHISAIYDYVRYVVLTDDTNTVERLTLEGWNAWPCEVECVEELSLEATEFFRLLPEFQANIRMLHTAAEKGRVCIIETMPDTVYLIQGKDETGMGMLHKAVIYQHLEVVQCILKHYPAVINTPDQLERTALHYAAALPDSGMIYEVLLKAGADRYTADLAGNMAETYRERPDLVNIDEICETIEMVHRRETRTSYKFPLIKVKKHPEKHSVGTNTNSVDARHAMGMTMTKATDTGSSSNSTYSDITVSEDMAMQSNNNTTANNSQVSGQSKKNEIKVKENSRLSSKNPASSRISNKVPNGPIPLPVLHSVKQKAQRTRSKSPTKKINVNTSQPKQVQKPKGKKTQVKDKLPEKPVNTFITSQLYYTIVNNDIKQMGQILEACSDDWNEADIETGNSFLHLAVMHNCSWEIIIDLLSNVDITRRNYRGFTAFDTALRKENNGEVITEFVRFIEGAIRTGDVETLEDWSVQGWSVWPDPESFYVKETEILQDFLISRSIFQGLVCKFHQATMEGDILFLRMLRDAVILFKTKDQTGLTPLHKAAIRGHLDVITFLVDEVPETIVLNDQYDRIPVHYAAIFHGIGDIYQHLINNGSDIHVKDRIGNTPCDYLQLSDDAPVELQQIKANVSELIHGEEQSHPGQRSSELPWSYWKLVTINAGQNSITALSAMENTALYKAVSTNDISEALKLLNADEDTNIRATDGKSLLHVAVNSHASIDIFKAILNSITDFTSRDENGDSVIDLIFRTSYSIEGENEVMAKIQHKVTSLDEEGLEEFTLSGWNVWPKATDKTIQKLGDAMEMVEKIHKFQDKVTTIHTAVQDGNLHAIQSLIDRKRLAVASDRTGLPPLHKAAIFQQSAIVKEIISKYPESLNSLDHMGRTVLHYAAGLPDAGHAYQMIKELAEPDEAIVDLKGHTAANYLNEPALLDIQSVRSRIETTLAQTPILSRSVNARSAGSRSNNKHGDSKEPIKMFLSPDMYERGKAPQPFMLDSKYLAANVGTPLTMALAEIVEKRPTDPIEFLGLWLKHWHKINSDNQKQKKKKSEIKSAMNAMDEKVEKQAQCKDEMRKLRKDEKLKEKQREDEEKRQQEARLKPGHPDLATVTEERSDLSTKTLTSPPVSRERNEDGQTELHRMAAQPGSDLTRLLNNGHSLSDRDARNNTARDIAQASGINGNIEALDLYAVSLIKEDKFDALEKLVLSGYSSSLTTAIDRIPKEAISVEMDSFIHEIPNIQARVEEVFSIVKNGTLRDVEQVLARKNLPMAQNQSGQTPLHLAVLYDYKDVAEYIAKSCPDSLNLKDNLDRTALHYAYAVSEEIVETLTSLGADKESKDSKQKLPADYKETADEILQMRESNQLSDNEQVEQSQPPDDEQVEQPSENQEQPADEDGN